MSGDGGDDAGGRGRQGRLRVLVDCYQSSLALPIKLKEIKPGKIKR